MKIKDDRAVLIKPKVIVYISRSKNAEADPSLKNSYKGPKTGTKGSKWSKIKNEI